MANPQFTPEELASEEWRDIDGYETLYSVSSLGRIRKSNGKILSTNSKRSYCRVRLKDRVHLVHGLVAKAFLGECPDGYEVNHKDLNKSNPRLSNLEYVTRLENIHHAMRNGRRFGSLGPRARKYRIVHGPKLSRDDVIEIRRAIISGVRQREIAGRFGITSNLVCLIKRERAWTHVIELRDDVRTACGKAWQKP